jgi:uncharacterized RDD family membrane protein YckC
MSGGQEGTRWPEPPRETPFTWGSAVPYTWGPSSDAPTPPEGPRYATWGRRWVGFLLDLLLMVSVPIAFFIAFAVSLPYSNNSDPPMTAASWVWFYCWLASCTVVVLYPVWFIGRRGQTPGMKVSDIRLYQVQADGSLGAPSWKCAWGRTVAAVVGWFLFVAWILDYLWPLGDSRHQCIHDKIARTIAVDVRPEGVPQPYGARGLPPIDWSTGSPVDRDTE